MASVFSFYEEKARNGLFECLNREFRGSVGSPIPIPIYRLTKHTQKKGLSLNINMQSSFRHLFLSIQALHQSEIYW